MGRPRSEVLASKDTTGQITQMRESLNSMKKGYKEMAEINLAISTLYFEVESEAQSYYDRIAECE